MTRFATAEGRLALVCICLAGLALAVWIPTDIDTGLVEQARRRLRIGDAMLPVLGLGFVIAGGALTLFAQQPDAPRLTLLNVAFVIRLLLVLALSFTVMRWLGPLVVDMAGVEGGYRALRDTPPWKYIGFVAGGTVLVSGLMALVEGRPSLRGLGLGLAAALALLVIYDLPFEDLLLPPNGDV
jgi:hypothetical protein